MADVSHLTLSELEAGLEEVLRAPKDRGTVRLIVRRPAVDEREVLDSAELDAGVGLVGDTWSVRGSSSTVDGSAHPEKQLTIVNARAIALVAGDGGRWPLAGDQLYIDMDVGEENLPAGARVSLGTAIVEITEPPHTGCKKYAARFGADALRFVNSPRGRSLRLRGANARVIQPGTVRIGDTVTKAPVPDAAVT